MNEIEHYAISGGMKGRERLALLSSILAASTGRLLDLAGDSAGARRLDAGCGGGDVALELARRAGPWAPPPPMEQHPRPKCAA